LENLDAKFKFGLLTLDRRLANNQLNGSLTIPALIGQNIKLVSLQNNSIMNVDQVSANGNYSRVQFEYVCLSLPLNHFVYSRVSTGGGIFEDEIGITMFGVGEES
jgi:hypothetical protein